MAKSTRWTQDQIRSARANLSARINTLLRFSESQLRAEFRAGIGAEPDTSVSLEALRRWLIDCAIDVHLPNNPPQPKESTHAP